MKLTPNNHNEVRRYVLTMACEGRATCLPAGARDNATALILIDGEAIGQASELAHYVREVTNGTTFGEQALIPGYDWQLPEDMNR